MLVRYLQRETYTKTDGIKKLVLAYFVSSMLAALLWAVPVSVAAVLLLGSPSPGEPERTFLEILQSLPRAYILLFFDIVIAGFTVSTIALVVGGYFFWRFRLFDKWHLNLYACFCVALVAFFVTDGNIRQTMNVLLHFGVPVALGAMTISGFFWRFGVRGNYWLMSSK